MPRQWVAPVSVSSSPRTILSLAYDPLDHPTGGRGYRTVAGGWSACVSVRDGRQWVRRPVRSWPAAEIDDVWRYVDDVGRERGRAYMVTRCASDTLTLAGFWARVDAGAVSLRLADDTYADRDGRTRRRRPHPLILCGSPDVVGWSCGAAEYRAVGLSNHLPMPILDAARSCGVADPPAARWADRPTGHADPDSAWTADALASIYERLMSWWLERGGGRWADTVGAAAWQWWRSTLAAREVLEHDQPSAMAMERAAVYGGRAQLFWFGSAGADGQTDPEEPYLAPAVLTHLPGAVHKLDVRSMYASLMAAAEYPTRLAHRLRPRTPRDLLAASERWCVVATVRVRSAGGSVPYHDPHAGTVYPAGEWWATLTTPELMDGLVRGEIVDVGEAWAYHRGRPLAGFAASVLECRQHAREEGDALAECMAKVVANALGGRLARTYRGWTLIPGRHPRQRWGEWCEIDADTGETARYRGVAGMMQQHVTRDERPGGLTAIYAHLTAYGRVMLRRLMDVAGDGQTLWCDTDGLIVTARGLDALTAAGEVHEDAPGRLRYVEEVRSFVGRTPKHYRTQHGWTLSGARGDWRPVDRASVRCWLTANPVRSGQRPDGSGLLTVSPLYHLDAIPLSGVPRPDGWLSVPTVRDGALHQPDLTVVDPIDEMES